MPSRAVASIATVTMPLLVATSSLRLRESFSSCKGAIVLMSFFGEGGGGGRTGGGKRGEGELGMVWPFVHNGETGGEGQGGGGCGGGGESGMLWSTMLHR